MPRSAREAELTERIAALEGQCDDLAAAQAAELAEMSGKVAALQSQVRMQPCRNDDEELHVVSVGDMPYRLQGAAS